MKLSEKITPTSLPDCSEYPHTVFLKNVINDSQIEIGDYTYYHDFHMKAGDDYMKAIFPYLTFHIFPEKLTIGKFCQIAQGTKFLTRSSMHQYDGVSTYPFYIFASEDFSKYDSNIPDKGNTKVGNDVWFGQNVTILPGINIGSGAIIGANSVVTHDVPDYAVVAGNPATLIRMRFSEEEVNKLIKIQWWNWPDEVIFSHVPEIVAADIDALGLINAQTSEIAII